MEATLAGSVLIVVLMGLRQVFRKRIGSRMVHVAWARGAIRLLLPIAIPNPLMDGLRPTYSSDTDARLIADQVRIRDRDAMADASYWLSNAAYEGNATLQQGLATVAQELSTYTP